MVGPQNHDGVIGQSKRLEFSEEASNQGVDIADRCVVAMFQPPLLLFGEEHWRFLRLGEIHVAPQFIHPEHRHRCDAAGQLGVRREGNRPGIVEVPVLLWWRE